MLIQKYLYRPEQKTEQEFRAQGIGEEERGRCSTIWEPGTGYILAN